MPVEEEKETDTIPINISKGWLPDFLPNAMPIGALLQALNLYPYDEKYYPALNPLAYSTSALSGTPIGNKEFFSNDGNYYLFCGTTTKLYRLETNQSLTDITRAAGAYTASTTRWDFTKTSENIIATNYADVPQRLTGMTVANFVALGGSPPNAKFCLFFKGHLILAYLNDGTVYPQKLIWSAYDSIADFAQSLTTGADSRNLTDADGEITGLKALGSMLIVFHRNSITIGWYSRAPFTFSFDTLRTRDKGAIEGTPIVFGNVCYFFDERDFYKMTPDGLITPIGMGIKNTILNDLDIGSFYRISAGSDARRGVIYWSYPSVSSEGTPDTLVAYNPKMKMFTKISLNHSGIFTMHKKVLDADSMDAIYPDADTVPWEADSSYWLDNSAMLACINSDGKVAHFGGTAMTWIIETSEFGYDDKIIAVLKIRPKVEKAIGNISVQIGSRFKETDDRTYSSTSIVDSYGNANTRTAGRYCTTKISGGLCDGISSINAEAVIIGSR